MEPALCEFALIAELFAPLSGAGAFGLRDDAAVIAPRAGYDLVVTTDAVIAGVDFFAHDPPDAIARKALRVNLSDLAAKGAAAQSYLLNLSLPGEVERAWIEDFARGLGQDQEHFGIRLLGGDTGRTPGPLSIAVTAFGLAPSGAMIPRGGAKPGEAVFVTGTIGDGGGGLALCRGEGERLDPAHRAHLVERYRVPEPRMAFGAALRGVATASVDVSDGLVADLGHVADASGVRILIDGARVPRSVALDALWGGGADAVLRAVTAGDDYEIAFTAPPEREDALRRAAARAGHALTRIGDVRRGAGAFLELDGADVPLARRGYRHF